MLLIFDDTVVFSNSWEDHLLDFRRLVWCLLQDFGRKQQPLLFYLTAAAWVHTSLMLIDVLATLCPN